MTPTAPGYDLRHALARGDRGLDPFDEIRDAVLLADEATLRHIARQALVLIGDTEEPIRTGAVAVLNILRHAVTARELAEAIVREWDGVRADGADALLLLAEVVGESDGDAVDLVLEWCSDTRLRGALLSRLARSVPESLCRSARDWMRTADGSILLALPTVEHRQRLARALAPWPEYHVNLVLEAHAARPLAAGELDSVLAAMAG